MDVPQEIHKDYSSANPIQISVYSDKIIFWNEGSIAGKLDNITIEGETSFKTF